MRKARRLGPVVLSLAVSIGVGCDLTRFTANTSANLFSQGSSGLQQHFDYELVGDGLPGNILTLEGVFGVVPDNQPLGIALIQAYVSYGYGWVEDELEQAQDAGNFEEEERLMGRSRLLYERGKNIGVHLMRQRDRGIDQALGGGHEDFERYIAEHYTSASDVPLLFWTGYAWAAAVNAGRDDPEMILSLPFARTILFRAVELDPTYYNHSSLTLLGVLHASIPEALGGNTDRAREYFEQALEATERKFFTVQFSYARTYAVQVQDRNLYIRLLREIVDGGDPNPSARLANRMMRRRAIRWLRRTDQLF
jgi:hypothetical protein